MSSESEDEFQSADEGSDLEDLECNLKRTLLQQHQPVHAAPCERVCEAEEDAAQNEASKKVPSTSTSDAEDDVDTNKNREDTSERTQINKESDLLGISEDESSSMSVSCTKDDESIKETPVQQLEVGRCIKDNDTQEICEKSYSCVEELRKGFTAEKLEKSDKFQTEELKSDKQNYEVQSEELIEDSEEKSEDVKCKQKVSSQTALSENLKTECIADEVEPLISNSEPLPENKGDEPLPENKGDEVEPLTSNTEPLPGDEVEPLTSNTNPLPENKGDEVEPLASNSKPKPVRQSKIGMKKPREKLGERLGTRKLGTKVANKSIDGISSDSLKYKEEDRNTSTNKSRSPLTAKTVEKNREKEDEKMKKRQQWVEQQERWNQALNLDKDKKEASGNDDGWSAPWGGWGGTLLSAASTFTREVGRGVGTVMETVESSIGVPSPEVMAEEVCKSEHLKTALEEKTTSQSLGEGKQTESEKQTNSKEDSVGGDKSGSQVEASYGLGGFSLGSLVSGVSGALETASSKVLMGGLDTLEVIGRKAMDVIQEGDPGLHKKRAFLSNKKPNLSQMLQEARQRAMQEEKDGIVGGGNNKNLQKPSFEQAWEATEGPVHLEALSLVAKQCQTKRTSMAATLPHYVQEKLLRENTVIKTTCELDELEQLEEDVTEVVSGVVTKMGLQLHPKKLIEAWSLVQEKAAFVQEVGLEETGEGEGVLFSAMAQLVAQLCALAHKGGELALITPDADPLDLASHFKELAQVVSCGLEKVADQVCGAITSEGSPVDSQVSNTITNIYLQAANGNNYIQESLVLLASVLQYSNTKSAASHL
ncbi:protein FAM114A2-like [Portunus trituberculatus]|uniref:protein FAM114A2-like n=1 Tax=Portunus trituberculatus TaxID=210409 RepID=UPI001E1D0256|nr:protein FAM114A2-like [Portunus trituberculatus]